MSIGPLELVILAVIAAVVIAPVVIIAVVVIGASKRRSAGPPAPPPPTQWAVAPPPGMPATAGSVAEQLRDLAALRDQGVLTEDEFAVQKARILG